MDSTDRLDGAAAAGGTGDVAPKTDPSARRRFSITITTRSLLLGAALGTAILVGIVLFTHALGTLIALLLAIILGEAIRPLVARLHRYRIPSAVAILLIYLVGAIIAGLLIWLLLNPLISQINTLVTKLPTYLDHLRQVIPGTLLATALLVPYISLFPLYVNRFLRPDNYGSFAGFAVVILIFLYYLGFILLLGAELNSWIAGRRLVGGDLAAVLQTARLHADEAAESAEAHTDAESSTGMDGADGAQDKQNRDG